MKHFTEPNGKFVLKIPNEWQYKNIIVGHEEVSPFSFELYENSIGAFQISCYSELEKPSNSNLIIQNSNIDNLDFLKARMDGGGFNMHLWYARVDDHFFMVKYIYEEKDVNDPRIAEELAKVEKSLSSLEFISEDKRKLALDLDKYEKFIASLMASFDLKNKAFDNNSLIEYLIITANQIDAYLRMAIVLKKQLNDNTNDIDIVLLFQSENDTPIMERKIYLQSKDLGIISNDTFNELERLYKERNKVVHRFIISDFKTRFLYDIAYEYENIYEPVRLALGEIEELQFIKGIGIHGNGRNPNDIPTENNIKMLYSQVNDKHLMSELNRKIKY